MKRLFWMLVLALFLFGLWLICYPALNTAQYERQADAAISVFQEAQRTAAQQESVAGSRTYAALYQAMEQYNQTLFQQHQAGLTGQKAYETPALSLADYGLETGEAVGYLEIPAIDLSLPLYLGASTEHMALGAVVLGQTSLPIGGTDTNCVIARHRGYRGIPYFRHLDRLKPGDRIYLANLWEVLVYEVVDSAIIEPDNIDAILIQPGQDRLTLLTCHPYGVGTQRLVIQCERISV